MYIQPNSQISINMAEKFIAAAPQAAARFFESLSTHEALQYVAGLKAEYIVLLLSNMTPARTAVLLRRLPVKQAAYVTSSFNINFAAQVLEALPAHHKTKIESTLPQSFKAELKAALAYPPGSVGTVMRGDFFTFKTDVKVEDIVTKFKNLPRKKIPAQIYILDKSGRLGGVIRTLELVFFQPDAMAGSVMQAQFPAVKPAETEANALQIMADNFLPELPVVNKDGVLVGIFEINVKTKKEAKPNKKGILSIFKDK
ncbi:magnesium transporter [Elusimicrobium simillimum]|uniref:magnesium transporter MgtE N-terminal domain-containing protein n=1 Tax=Elusimicrobium simillimum TaxID=3143438 RepID=UPI003C6EFFEC